jgi:hypothetical protein
MKYCEACRCPEDEHFYSGGWALFPTGPLCAQFTPKSIERDCSFKTQKDVQDEYNNWSKRRNEYRTTISNKLHRGVSKTIWKVYSNDGRSALIDVGS